MNEENNLLKQNIEQLNKEIKNLNELVLKKDNKIKLFEEEKNNLINNFYEKEKEFNENKAKIVDLSQNIEKLKGELSSEIKENEKIKKKYNDLNNENSKINLLLKDSDDKLKQFEEKYNSLKNDLINKENKNNDIENLIEKNNQIIKEKHELENEIKKINLENKAIVDEMIKSKSEIENKYNDTIKENEKLQNKIKQLSNFQDNSEEQLNTINAKYREMKKTLAEKEKELTNLREASQALIQKEKNQVDYTNAVDPDKWKIITEKVYKRLKWYLIYEKENKKEEDENKYENYRWVNGTAIKRDELGKYNKYETDDQKIKDMNEYIIEMQKKLEKKEESYSKLDFQNKKLMQDIHNKTAGNALLNPLSRGVSGQVKNTSIDIGSGGFKNILEELNNSNMRQRQLQNKVIKLSNQLKEKGIDYKMEEDIDNNIKKEDNIQKNNDLEELNLLRAQLVFLKEELKENKTKLEQLIGQVKELLKNVKCDNKNKPQFVQICQILNLSPKTTNRIINNVNKKTINF